jgi:DNA-binding NtrC family response regulator
VLHIDRDRDFLGVSTNILNLFGHFTVDFAQTTKQAEQLLKQKNYDVIISAFYLTDINGLEFLKKLKQAGVKSKLVLFTGNNESAEQATKEGIHFIVKYGDPDKVFAELCQIMKSPGENCTI